MSRTNFGGDLAPARPPRKRPGQEPEPVTSDYDDADLARGQAAAVLGALGRMQLRLDVLAREQTDMFAKVLSALGEITERLDSLEFEPAEAADPVQDDEPVATPHSD